MKKLFFFAAFLVAASLTTVNAQSCSKGKIAGASCCAKTSAKAVATAISADSSIEKKVCSVSGKETFYRNSTCETTGKVTSTEVMFDAKQNTFVNVSPTRASQPAAEATATSSKKASCAKSCSKGKAACGAKASTKQASTKVSTQSKATFTKAEMN